MLLNLSAIEKGEAERLILVLIIGLLEALESKKLTIEDTERYLFSPYSVNILEKKKIDPEIIEIVELGCELEDIESLIPKKLPMKIFNLKERALKIIDQTKEPEDLFEAKKWLDSEHTGPNY